MADLTVRKSSIPSLLETGVKSVLVTGASGFIGRTLCRRLSEQQVAVRALLRHKCEGPWQDAVYADIGSGILPKNLMEGIDSVFHLAGKVHALSEASSDETEYNSINVNGTRVLLEAAATANVRCFVFFSSVKAMGEGGETMLDENCDIPPETPYGRSKRKAEELVLGKGYVPHPSVLRLSMVYGPGSKGNLVRMIEAVVKRRFPPLPQMYNRRSMVHVDDVVQAAILAAENPEASGQTYIVTDGQTYSTRQIYEWISESLDRSVSSWGIPLIMFKMVARAGTLLGSIRGRRVGFDTYALQKLIGSAWYSSKKIERELGFLPKWSLRKSLPGIMHSMGFGKE